jgi:hypothetical protein
MFLGKANTSEMSSHKLKSPVAVPNLAASRIGDTAGGGEQKSKKMKEIQADETLN